MRYYLLLLAGMFLLASPNVNGQKNWSLDECVKYAIANNLDVRDRVIQSDLNKETFNQSKRNLLPYISLGGNGSNSFGKSLDYDTYEYTNTSQFYGNIGVSTGIDVFRGFIRQNTISYRKMNYLAGIEDEKQQKYDIAFSVMGAYYNTVYYYGLMEIVGEQKELSRLNVERAQKQVALGLKAKSDLLEMESRMAKEELNYIQAENSYKKAFLDLRQTMNIPLDEDFIIDFDSSDEGIIVLKPTTPTAIFSEAQNFYPTIKAVELRKEAAQKNVSIAKGSLWPSLAMQAGYNSYYSKIKGKTNGESFSSQLKNNASQYFGFSFDIPVFQKFGLRSDVKLARLNYMKAEVALEKTSQQLLNEITLNYHELESYNSEYNQLLKQVDFSQVAYDAAVKKMEQGLLSVIELYDSKNLLAQAKSDLLRTKLQYIVKRKTIDYYLGKPVFEISALNEN